MMIPCEFKEHFSDAPTRRGWLVDISNNSNDTKVLVAYDDKCPASWGWSKGSLALQWVEPRHVRILRTEISLFAPASQGTREAPDAAKAPAVVTATVNQHKEFCTPDRCYCGPQ